jgi:hypothetical protein
MVMRLIRLRAKNPGCTWRAFTGCADADLVDNVVHAQEMLLSERRRDHRTSLFAALADAMTDPSAAERMGAPRSDEPSPMESVPWLAEDWLAHAPDGPSVPAERYEASGQAMVELAGSTHPRLLAVAHSMFALAAGGYARRGDLGAADRCIVRAGLDETRLVLMRAQAALVAGDRQEAATRADVEAAAHPALLLFRAELAMPDAERARALGREALLQSKNPVITERARWLLLTLGVATRGASVVETVTPPARYRFVGFDDGQVRPAVRSRNLDDALAMWFSWLHAPNRRQVRYTAWSHRGDAPPGLTPYVHAGALLGDAEFSAEQTEIWLDALTAFDNRRFSIRQVAFARWRAAAWRGAREAAEVWRKRYLTLARLGEAPETAELLGAMRL